MSKVAAPDGGYAKLDDAKDASKDASCAPLEALGKQVQRWRDAQEPSTVLLADVAATLFCWLVFGVFFFRRFSHGGHFTWAYSFYFCINVGYGIGSAPFRPSHAAARLVLCAYLVAGQLLIVGGLGAYFQASAARLERATGAGPRRHHLSLLSLGYAVVVGWGLVVGRAAGKMGALADCLVFSLTNLTTAGLKVGRYTRDNWLATAFFMLVGVPYAMLYFSEVSTALFAYDGDAAGPEAESLLPGSPEPSPLARLRRWRRSLKAAQLQALDLLALFAAWLLTGVLAFRRLGDGWSYAYAFYFAVNTGVGCGSAPYRPTSAPGKFYECAHCVFGQVIIIGGIRAYCHGASERARRAAAADAGVAAATNPVLTVGGAVYAGILAWGLYVGYLCGYRGPVHLLYYSVSNATSAGLFVRQGDGHEAFHVWIVSALYLLVAVPYTMFWFSEITSVVFAQHEQAVVTRRRSLRDFKHRIRALVRPSAGLA